ncbi:MAG TPA: epoxide hydrolase, partial [Pseudonocardiaceae bacterium]|nr:epoxide hydrolase [Pseudonocardiaceae bacterium]
MLQRCHLNPETLADLHRRLVGYQRTARSGTGWAQGVPRDWLDTLLEDWRDFDTDAFQLRLDALDHRQVRIAEQSVHMVLGAGRGPKPLPLLLTHGWPGSFLEYLPILDLLANPGAHGADPVDAFTVIVPSLPGYAFSAPPPPTGMTGRQVAGLWHELMTQIL